MKKIKFLKNVTWSIAYKAVEFKKNQEIEVQKDVPFAIADNMVKSGFAEVVEAYCPTADKKSIVAENKAFDAAPENKSVSWGATENKSVPPTENSEKPIAKDPLKKKPGRPKK